MQWCNLPPELNRINVTTKILSPPFMPPVVKALESQACRPWVCQHCQILADHLTLFQPGGTDYAHLITTGTPGFSDLPTALKMINKIVLWMLRSTNFRDIVTILALKAIHKYLCEGFFHIWAKEIKLVFYFYFQAKNHFGVCWILCLSKMKRAT